jgi:hypothetical protein
LRSILWRHNQLLNPPPLINTANKSECIEESEDDSGHDQGPYTNYEYGYYVTIPEGLIGDRSPAPNPQHGFGIDLSKPDNAQVWVDGSYNALEWGSLDEAANETLRYLKDDDVSNIRVTRRRYARLSNLRAVRIEVSYQKAGRSMIDDEIIAFRQERDIVYTLQLTTTRARYSEDVKVLNQLQKTFRHNAQPYP